uniref:RanBP2-type domain-containing protein n=1 Tax=Megaselia scalaris TaxID=36166 RepID=T1GN13_MEGSC
MSDPKPFTFKMTTQEENKSTPVIDTSLDKSTNSNYEEDAEYDPRPDFKPIIPLPDEIEVKTGEEDEECLFSNRAKLFRHSENDWKERGIGIIKILKNKENKCRILMRREQIHKICANHTITNEMTLTILDKEKKGFIWVANDFAEEVLSKEKFFVRFKNAEIANEFYNVFKKASESSVPTPVKQDAPKTKAAPVPTVVPAIEKKTFSFSLNKQDSTTSTPNKENAAPSPFANLNFGQSPSAGSSPFEPDEYVPTAEFAPVIPLPDLVEVVTGEENDNVLYVHRAKLLRFDKASNEWKERGIGDIKILQNKVDLSKIRLVMRREIIHKLCCNQRIYKDTDFKFHPNSKKAVMWVGQDYSENELAIETLTLRFKTEEICGDFMKAIKEAQSYIVAEQEDNDDDTESENVSYSDNNSSDIVADPTLTNTQGFGDKFKIKAGSWNCEACYVQNDGDSANCLACNTPKEKPAKPSAPKPVNNGPPLTSGFGDKFKPAAGSWNCKACYLSNVGADLYCKACEAPKDDTVPKKEPKSLVLEKPKTSFTFGFAAANTSTEIKKPDASIPTFGFGASPAAPQTSAVPTFGFPPSHWLHLLHHRSALV